MIIIKTLTINNKNLNTSPIRTLMRSGENNADTIIIEVQRFYDDLDLSQFGFVMEGRNSSDTLAVENLTFDTLDDTLRIFFVVTKDFTAVSGPLKLTLKAVSSTNDTCLVFTGKEVEVVGSSNEDCLPVDIGEQLLTQIEETIADFEAQFETIASQQVAQQLEIQLSEKNCVTSQTIREILTLTQSEYDALTEPDESIMYMIIGE